MKKDQWAFLIGGIAFGILFGYGLFNALEERPDASASAQAGPAGIPSPAGPDAPAQGGAPMVGEINELKRVLQQEPTDLGALFRVAQLYGTIGMWESVDPFFAQAIEAAPEDHRLPLRLASFLAEVGQCERAIPFYDRALSFHGDDPDVIASKGVCLSRSGRPEEALQVLRSALRVDPEHWQSLFNTVIVAGFDLGRYDEAGAALERLEQVKPDAPGLEQLRRELANATRGAS